MPGVRGGKAVTTKEQQEKGIFWSKGLNLDCGNSQNCTPKKIKKLIPPNVNVKGIYTK